MAKRQPPKRLFKGQDRVSSYQANRSGGKLLKQMSRDHLDVLQNIEGTLIAHQNANADMDDRLANEALRALINGTAPSDSAVAKLVGELEEMCRHRPDVTDDVWKDGLRVVLDSVHTHSELRPGETAYLDFVRPYVSPKQLGGRVPRFMP